MSRRGRDPSAPLVRALLADAAAAGCRASAESSEAADWSSATFVGARHRLVLSAPHGPALSHWLAGLSSARLALPHALVGELRVDRVEQSGTRRRIALSALTIEAA
ncbi:hypothetical protein Q5H91_01325 [Sphingomonas sp. KR1UV-12]|uniref:Uncharacterized protein n=1 Tax=Sphingomonas aurea TaxID=3063994 RepID=A0ABT9EFV5_9SPHN|nr:hypothetical protein [Sphingomonas sp. KR1UV-12]MDP1025844.1 hypothetical protein [Sphingomonas sp. KR1UV-12]